MQGFVKIDAQPWAVITRSEHYKAAEKRNRVKEWCREFVEAGINVEHFPDLIPTSSTKQFPADESDDDKKTLQTYPIEWGQDQKRVSMMKEARHQ